MVQQPSSVRWIDSCTCAVTKKSMVIGAKGVKDLSNLMIKILKNAYNVHCPHIHNKGWGGIHF